MEISHPNNYMTIAPVLLFVTFRRHDSIALVTMTGIIIS